MLHTTKCPTLSSLISSTVYPDIQHCLPWYPTLSTLISNTVFPDIQHCCPWYPTLSSLISNTVYPDIQHCLPWYPTLSTLISNTVYPDIQHCLPWYPTLANGVSWVWSYCSATGAYLSNWHGNDPWRHGGGVGSWPATLSLPRFHWALAADLLLLSNAHLLTFPRFPTTTPLSQTISC